MKYNKKKLKKHLKTKKTRGAAQNSTCLYYIVHATI
jgi:hypothetical protein